MHDAAKNILGDFKPFLPGEIEDDQEVKEDERRLVELVESGKHADHALHTADMDIAEPPAQRRRVGSGLRLKQSSEALDSHSDYMSKCQLGGREKTQIDVTPTRWADSESQIHGIDSLPFVRSPIPLQQRPKRNRKPRLRPDEIYHPPPPPSPSPELPPLADTTPGSDVPMPMQCESGSSTTYELGKEKKPPILKLSRSNSKLQNPQNCKAPSETFNLPWSLSEQHLLEKLLGEIPAGEKHRCASHISYLSSCTVRLMLTIRWAKISKAMAGKRTPRQVASRVQKYFEKLKKFGVDPD